MALWQGQPAARSQEPRKPHCQGDQGTFLPDYLPQTKQKQGQEQQEAGELAAGVLGAGAVGALGAGVVGEAGGGVSRRMAHRTLPILFINLGGEMMYILDQRLKAQAIDQEKAAKVMDDIVSTMFNRRFIEEIFKKHQPIHSRRVRHSRE